MGNKNSIGLFSNAKLVEKLCFDNVLFFIRNSELDDNKGTSTQAPTWVKFNNNAHGTAMPVWALR